MLGAASTSSMHASAGELFFVCKVLLVSHVHVNTLCRFSNLALLRRSLPDAPLVSMEALGCINVLQLFTSYTCDAVIVRPPSRVLNTILQIDFVRFQCLLDTKDKMIQVSRIERFRDIRHFLEMMRTPCYIRNP
jgi:hypothetical protein